MIGTLLERQGWRLEMLDNTHYLYTKQNYQFEIVHAHNSVFVTVPLPGSDSRYRTRLDSIDHAESYLEKHMEYIKKIEINSLDQTDNNQ